MKIIETRIATYRFSDLDEKEEHNLKEVCQRFAKDMRYDHALDYYAVYWEEANWFNANLALPGIDRILQRIP